MRFLRCTAILLVLAALALPASYADAVSLAGGAPVLFPVPGPTARASLEDIAHAVLGGVDGLLLTGGPDVDPEIGRAHV